MKVRDRLVERACRRDELTVVHTTTHGVILEDETTCAYPACSCHPTGDWCPYTGRERDRGEGRR